MTKEQQYKLIMGKYKKFRKKGFMKWDAIYFARVECGMAI
jgi:hypothetical protein